MSTWVRGIIYASVFCLVALSLTPEGKVKTAEKLLCGIVMLFVIFSPIIELDIDTYASAMAKYTEVGKELANEGKESGERMNRTIIENELCAYILDKAESFGVRITSVSVGVAWSDEGYWYPVSAEISGSFSSDGKKKLTSVIAADLGIGEGEQSWTEVSE